MDDDTTGAPAVGGRLLGIGPASLGVVAAAAIAIVALAAGLIAVADRIDAMARAHAEQLVANGVRVKQETLRACVDTESVWDGSVTHLDNRYDAVWAESNIGKFFKTNCDVGQVFVFGADDRVLGGWSDGRKALAMGPGLRASIDDLIGRVRRREALRGPFPRTRAKDTTITAPIDETAILAPVRPAVVRSATGGARIAPEPAFGGRPLVALASLIQPDFGTALPAHATAPVLVVIQPMDRTYLTWLSSHFLLSGLEVQSPPFRPLAGDVATANLAGPGGAVIGRLAWSDGRPAKALALVVAPSLCLLLLVLLGVPAMTVVRERRHGRQLGEAIRSARVASEAKSRFIANMSHEIRTPMNGVLGVLHLLRRKDLDPDSALLVAEAMASGELLLSLLNDVLDLSRIEEGRLELNSAPVDPGAAVREVAGLFSAQARAKGVAFDLAVDSGVPIVFADGLRIRQVLLNLVGNAVKFTSRGAVTVRLIGKTAADGAVRLRFEVADTGIGIAPGSQGVIFKRFSQADGSTVRRFGGSGLGLSISEALVALMGGTIGFSSVEGEGSTFWFELEVARASAEAMARPSVAPEPEAFAGALRILLVEDNAANRLVASRILEALGASVQCAADGAQGLEAARSGRFDLVLMDVHMPVMDGIAATRAIREMAGAPGAVPIIGLTADVLAEQTRECLSAGMDDVAAKPIEPSALVAKIDAVLARPRAGGGAAARSAA